MALESLSDPVIIGQLCEQWAHIYDTHTSVDIYQRKVEIEQFLEGFNQLSDEDRLRLDRLNRYENISSALSRQLLLLIYEICDPAVKWYAPVDATSTTVAGSSDHSSATTAPTDNVAHESECNSKLDSNSNEEQVGSRASQTLSYALPPQNCAGC
uniref:Uncharacterized protein n=1 Tax=Anopheles maculatus TaxID=74869 RepID=A0A182SG13_9DIPT